MMFKVAFLFILGFACILAKDPISTTTKTLPPTAKPTLHCYHCKFNNSIGSKDVLGCASPVNAVETYTGCKYCITSINISKDDYYVYRRDCITTENENKIENESEFPSADTYPSADNKNCKCVSTNVSHSCNVNKFQPFHCNHCAYSNVKGGVAKENGTYPDTEKCLTVIPNKITCKTQCFQAVRTLKDGDMVLGGTIIRGCAPTLDPRVETADLYYRSCGTDNCNVNFNLTLPNSTTSSVWAFTLFKVALLPIVVLAWFH